MKYLYKSLSATVVAVALVAGGAAANADPFPGVATGQEIPGTRVSSSPGESWDSFNAGAGAGFSCPAGAGTGVGTDLGGTSSRADDVRYYYCVKTWQAPESTAAWDAYNQQLADAQAAALAESTAWNEANPGKQKCVTWGPITDPNGGSSSGAVCANPVSLPEGDSVPSSDAGSISEEDVDTGTVPPAPQSQPSASDPQSDGLIRGSGYPFTRIVSGQVSAAECPPGYQAANGLIADVSSGETFTECWPESANTAYRLGGETWELFKATDGQHNPNLEIERQAKVGLLIAKAQEIASAAAAETPGIERCSSWSGFGESGRECAYVFLDPQQTDEPVAVDLSSEEVVESEAPITVGLDSAVVTGSAVQIASSSLLLAPTKVEAGEIASLAKNFSKMKTWQKGYGRNLPNDKELSFSYQSLTPKVCRANKVRLQIWKANTCLIEVTIEDSTGNSYVTKKIFKRRF